MALRPYQMALAINAIFRAKYRYGMMLLEETDAMKGGDVRWTDVVEKAIIRAKVALHETVRDKVRALLQLVEKSDLVGNYAQGLVRRWRSAAISGAEWDGERADVARNALLQAQQPNGNPSLTVEADRRESHEID